MLPDLGAAIDGPITLQRNCTQSADMLAADLGGGITSVTFIYVHRGVEHAATVHMKASPEMAKRQLLAGGIKVAPAYPRTDADGVEYTVLVMTNPMAVGNRRQQRAAKKKWKQYQH